MVRSFPVLLSTVLLAGVAGVQAHEFTPVARPVVSFAAASAVQDDLVAKVKAALKADSALAATADALTITAAGGVVTIDGTAPTVQVRAKIGEAVLKVEGVTKLVNKVKLPKK